MNNRVHIITDSGCDLTPAIMGDRDIEILKMPVTANGIVYEVNSEDDLMNIYKLMRAGIVFTTAHVSYYDLICAFRRCARQGIACVFVGLSSALTSQHRAAIMAAREVIEEFPDAVIEIIDSASATMGYGRAVLEGYDKACEGASVEEVVDTIIDELNCTEHLFSVRSLEFLVRGGRLSRVAGAVGDALSIRPILNIDDFGRLVSIEKVRGDKKLRCRLAEIAEESLRKLDGQEIYVVEGDNPDETQALIEKIQKVASPAAVHVYKMGPVIGVHTGPDVIGIVYKNPDRNKKLRAVSSELKRGGEEIIREEKILYRA